MYATPALALYSKGQSLHCPRTAAWILNFKTSLPDSKTAVACRAGLANSKVYPPKSETAVACRAWVTYSKTLTAKFPFPARSFVKASFFDGAQTLLVSKSVLYPALPPVRMFAVYGSQCAVGMPALACSGSAAGERNGRCLNLQDKQGGLGLQELHRVQFTCVLAVLGVASELGGCVNGVAAQGEGGREGDCGTQGPQIYNYNHFLIININY